MQSRPGLVTHKVTPTRLPLRRDNAVHMQWEALRAMHSFSLDMYKCAQEAVALPALAVTSNMTCS